MLNQNLQDITVLGIFILMLLLLIVFIILLFAIRRKQSLLLDSTDEVMKAIEVLQNNILTMDSIITGNFKELLTKSITIDSKLVSINDLNKDIAQAININHSKTMNVINSNKKSNKRRIDTKPLNDKYPPIGGK